MIKFFKMNENWLKANTGLKKLFLALKCCCCNKILFNNKQILNYSHILCAKCNNQKVRSLQFSKTTRPKTTDDTRKEIIEACCMIAQAVNFKHDEANSIPLNQNVNENAHVQNEVKQCLKLRKKGKKQIDNLTKKESNNFIIPKNIDKRNHHGETKLQTECRKGHARNVETLLRAKADPNTACFAGWTPLQEAVDLGYYEIVEILLKNGAEVDMPGINKRTPLQEAIKNKNYAMIDLLLEYKANNHLLNEDEKKTVDDYMKEKNKTINGISNSIMQENNVNSQEHAAINIEGKAEKDYSEEIIDQCDPEYQEYAKINRNKNKEKDHSEENIAQRDLEHQEHSTINRKKDEEKDHPEEIIDQCDLNENAKVQNEVKKYYKEKRETHIISKNINKRDHCGEIKLQTECRKGHARNEETLLKAKADPNSACFAGWTPLQEAVDLGHGIVEILLKNPEYREYAKINRNKNEEKNHSEENIAQSDLEHQENSTINTKKDQEKDHTEEIIDQYDLNENAHVQNEVKQCLKLRKKGKKQIDNLTKKESNNFIIPKNIDKRNHHGETKLQTECRKGHARNVETLLRAKADPNTACFAGWTPLQEAVDLGYYEIVEILLKNGAEVDMPGINKRTPLQEAIKNKNYAMIDLLLEYKANNHLLNEDEKKTVDDYMKEKNKTINGISNSIMQENNVNSQEHAAINIEGKAEKDHSEEIIDQCDPEYQEYAKINRNKNKEKDHSEENIAQRDLEHQEHSTITRKKDEEKDHPEEKIDQCYPERKKRKVDKENYHSIENNDVEIIFVKLINKNNDSSENVQPFCGKRNEIISNNNLQSSAECFDGNIKNSAILEDKSNHNSKIYSESINIVKNSQENLPNIELDTKESSPLSVESIESEIDSQISIDVVNFSQELIPIIEHDTNENSLLSTENIECHADMDIDYTELIDVVN